MIIIYIDIILLVVLLCLTIFACGYCFCRVRSLQRSGQVAILLRPTKVLFKHKKEDGEGDQLRTVVAYRNPFTGDYCVHKSRSGPKGYLNSVPVPVPVPLPVPVPVPESPDSGLSDEYEPLNLEPPQLPAPQHIKPRSPVKPPPVEFEDMNKVNKTWNWNYKEYQI